MGSPPHVRGPLQFSFFTLLRLGSPPHVRGPRIGLKFRLAVGGITPACAGTTNSKLHEKR